MKSLIDTILFQRTPVILQQTTTAKGNILDKNVMDAYDVIDMIYDEFYDKIKKLQIDKNNNDDGTNLNNVNNVNKKFDGSDNLDNRYER